MDRFEEWTRSLDPELRRSISNPGAWAVLTVLVSVVICVAGLVPGPREYFSLRVGPAFAMYAPTLAIGAGGGFLEQRGRLTARGFGMIALVNSALLQLFAWSLSTFADVPGAILMSVFPLIVGAYHGHMYNASARYPYPLASVAAAGVGAALMAPSFEHRWIVAVAAPASLGIALLLGTVSVVRRRQAAETDALRSAVQAQILEERAREVDALNETLLELRSTTHDAGNTLSSVLINVQSLLRRVESRNAGAPDAVGDVADDLREGLERLQILIADTNRVEASRDVDTHVVDLAEVVTDVVSEIGARYPAVEITAPGTLANGATLEIPVAGGRLALHRMLSNLVLNACQGDGRRGATRIRIEAESSQNGGLTLTVSDDGPGFGSDVLDGPRAWLRTTKPDGTGLGLYTTERLVRASRGGLDLENIEGGAMVSLHFPGTTR